MTERTNELPTDAIVEILHRYGLGRGSKTHGVDTLLERARAQFAALQSAAQQRDGYAQECHEVEQLLGRALGYPVADESIGGDGTEIVADQPPRVLAAMAAEKLAAQGMTLDDARKVLPSAEWKSNTTRHFPAGEIWHRRNREEPWFYIEENDSIDTECPVTIAQAEAAIRLRAAMQGDSPTAVALREEYAR